VDEENTGHAGGETVWAGSSRWAVLVTACVGLLWLSARMATGVAFGPWQGIFISSPDLFDGPLIAEGLYRLIGDGTRRGLTAMALLSVVLGAACGALVCAISWTVLRQFLKPPTATVLAAGTGIGFLFTPSFAYNATSASPTPLTLLFALACLYLLVRAWQADTPTAFLAGSGLCAGLAAANHPSFGLLVIPLLLLQGRQDYEPIHWYRSTFAILIPFTMACFLPLLTSVMSGETLAEFLDHALRTPYPAFGEASPAMDFPWSLRDELPVPILAAGLAGIALLFVKPHVPRAAVLSAMVFLFFGPFLPALTNQYGDGLSLVDSAATMSFVLAVVMMAAGWGAGAAISWLPESTPARTGAAALVCLTAVTWLAYQAPTRNDGLAAALGRDVLSACPANALLVSGAPEVTSLLTAVQSSEDIRRDVTILPEESLIDPDKRRAVRAPSTSVQLSAVFPNPGAWEEWAVERPNAFAALVTETNMNHGGRAALGSLALWDLVRDNHRTRPICFAAVNARWLTARAQIIGPMLAYPRLSHQEPFKAIYWASDMVLREDFDEEPGPSRFVTSLLVPLSETARLQNDFDRAANLADIGVELRPANEEAAQARLRVVARRGDPERAVELAEAIWPASSAPAAYERVTKALMEDNETARIHELLESAWGKLPLAHEAQDKVDAYLDRLYDRDELALVAQYYDSLIGLYPDESEYWFEYAALLTQLGYLEQARTMLTKWSERVNMYPVSVYRKLEKDGRFALLKGEAAFSANIAEMR